VDGTRPELRRTLNRAEAESDGWFNGPPFAVLESVFDEDTMPGCSSKPDEPFSTSAQ
jgi:hypothetical protein